MKIITIFLAAVGLLVACSVEVKEFGNHSGTIADPYVEEPISNASKKYERALEVSNEIVEQLRKGEYHEVYQKRCGPVFAAKTTESQFVELFQGVEKQLGLLTNYKPMQWDFRARKESMGWVLYSTKILEYEQRMVDCTFIFSEQGPYEQLLGFNFRVRPFAAPASNSTQSEPPR